MTPQRWKQVEAVFEQALELPPDRRLAFLENSCDGDHELRREVQSMLDAHARAGSFIDERSLFVSTEEIEKRDSAVASGQLIGSYRVVREIGRGGMGTVYLAERADEQYQKRVAIKLVKRGMDTDAVLRRFRNERQILASLDHPNVARLFDAGTTADGLPYFVMEYVEGRAIDKYCDAHRLSVRERLNLFCEICAAVAYAHRHAVIHRDIKSSNIVITTEGVPKLVDFGIAKVLEPTDSPETLLTTAALRPMTPQYASPEQIRGEALTAATDVYSLGVVLYELLTGQLPYRFVSQSPHDVARAITEQEPTRPSTTVAKGDRNSKFEIRISKLLRGDLDNIVLKALRKEPEQRYQSVEHFSEDIRRHLERRPIIARPVRLPTRVWRWSRRNSALAGAAIACLLLALAVVSLLREQFVARKATVPDKSIAILPFEYLSADKANAYLADGIQEEILTRLSKIADLKVISRTSTQRYKTKPENLPEIARQLGVAHILEGSVQKAADQLRVNVQLINAQTGSHLWAEKFDHKLQDIFSVETDIATKIADTLQAKLTGREQRAISARPTENTEAYQLYLQGRHLWAQREEAALLKAIDYFNQAIAKDPSYARAYAGIADCYIVLPYFSKLNSRECRAKAKAAATEALKIDNELADAHTSMGVLAANDLNFAKQEFLRAIDLDPNYANAYAQYGRTVLEPLGQFDEEIAQMKHAIELDPLSALYYANLAESYRMARRYSEAITQARKAVELEPAFSFGHAVLGIALDLSGQRDEALAEYRKAYELSHDFHVLPLIGRVYALKGDRQKALQLVDQLQELERQNSVSPHYGFALLYVALGDNNEALNRLERSYHAGEALTINRIKVDPLLDPLRGDPRFEKLANEVLAPETRAPEKSIAVLPFEYLGADKADAYLADGIQEEILTRLANVADLKVIAQTSTQRFKSAPTNLSQVAKQLGVTNILEGSVQRAGDKARVNVQLIDALTDSKVWAEEFDRKLTDIFVVETEVATKVADILQAKSTDMEQRAIALRPTQNSEAHESYLRGLYYWNRFLAPEFAKSRDYFQRAIDLDPSYAAAYAKLGLYYGFAAGNGLMPPEEGWPKAEAAVNKALALDETLAEAYNPLAAIKLYWYRDWPAAERAFRRGIELNPNLAELHLHYALCLILFARKEDASKEIRRGLELDPVSFPFNLNWGRILFLTRQYERAIEQFRTALDLEPNYALPHQWLGDTYEKKQMHNEAITEWSKALSLGGAGEDASLLERTYVNSGFDVAMRLLAQKQLKRLQEKTARGEYVPAVEYVTAYVRLGDKEHAFAWLTKAVEERNWFALHIKTNPMFDPLHGDPLFEKLTNEIITPDSPAPEKSIAVLPFKPLTSGDRDQVLEMGMADSLITKLSHSRGIMVPSVASIRKYGGLDQDPVAAGRELRVDSVLEGNVQRSGDRVRVSTRLIKVADGSSLWAGTFDEKFTDVFAVQDAISQKVADALALRLSGEQKNRLSKRYTENVDAYQLYLTGRYYWSRHTPFDIRKGIGFFQQAVNLDPNYALAYVGLAMANRALAINADVPSKDCLPQAKAAALKAIEIDDSLAEAHSCLSFALIWYDWDWAAADKEAKRAISLDPNSAMAHFAYAHVLSDQGLHWEAIAEIAHARELEPVVLLFPALEGMFLHHAGRNDEALARLQKTLELDPNFWLTHLMLGKVYTEQRKYSEAIAEFTKAKELSQGNSEAIGSIGYVAGLTGDKAKAQAVLDELKTRSTQAYVAPCNVALVYNALGEQDEALRWLDKAVVERDVRLTLLKVDPRWDSFRSNPQFIAILKRIGLQ